MLNKWLTTCALVVVSVSASFAEPDFVDGSALHDAGFMKFWQLQLPVPPAQKVVSAWRVDDAIYVATDGARVYALHAYTGAFRWMKEVTTAAYPIRRPCHIGALVVFVLPSEIKMYDRYSGQPATRVALDFPAGTPAVTDGEHLFIGGIDQRLYAFLPNHDYETWKTRTTGQIIAAPAVLGKHVYFAGDDGSVYACTTAQKRYYWSTRVFGSVSANLAADENGIYIATLDHSLFLLDPAFGGLRWRVQLSSPLEEPPVLTKEAVFQYASDEGVVAINTGPQAEVEKPDSLDAAEWPIAADRGRDQGVPADARRAARRRGRQDRQSRARDSRRGIHDSDPLACGSGLVPGGRHRPRLLCPPGGNAGCNRRGCPRGAAATRATGRDDRGNGGSIDDQNDGRSA